VNEFVDSIKVYEIPIEDGIKIRENSKNEFLLIL